MGQPAGWNYPSWISWGGGVANTARLLAPLRGKGRVTLVGVKSR